MKYWATIVAMLAFMVASTLAMSLGNSEAAQLEDAAENENNLDWLNYISQDRFNKRKFAPSDPRSLFKAVYSNYGKRYSNAPANDIYISPSYGAKRGLRSPLDPRNLYRAVYGYRK